MSEVKTNHIQEIVKSHFGLDCSVHQLESEYKNNYRIVSRDSEKSYVLKVSHSNQSYNQLDLENKAILAVIESNPTFKLPVVVHALNGDEIVRSDGYYIRLFHWIPGRQLAHVNPHHQELLEDLGYKLGVLSKSLQFFDHPSAHREFEWSPHSPDWVSGNMHLFNAHQMRIVEYVMNIFDRETRPIISQMRKSINHNDANDYNILVNENPERPEVIGFIDFGDLHYGPTINELAICLAYVMMGKPDPIGAACHVITGYHNAFPLQEKELDVLFGLICSRLLISVTKSAQRRIRDPQNAYWQISDQGAWELLEKLSGYSSQLALCKFRFASGMEPSPISRTLCIWLSGQTFYPVTGFELAESQLSVFDWSVGSLELGGFEKFANMATTTDYIFSRIKKEGSVAGIGRYNEPRPFYDTEEYVEMSSEGPAMRTIHLGIDIFLSAGSPVFAPLDGIVHTIVNNAGDKEYGPLLILEHHFGHENVFYTLYGHNSLTTLDLWQPGDQVKKGERIAEVGNYPENGNWVPHLHFQIITDLLNYKNDYPGVANPDHREIWLSLCPDPNLILGIRHPDLKYHDAVLEDILQKRKKCLPSNLSISYQQPLHIVRGWKQHLFDAQGRKYLDTINNIAHVGHEHPRIVEAGNRQMAVLNTNTRYLHTRILDLAETLLNKLPDHFEVAYFVNSGSEANELALRLARHYTSTKETIVLEQGYHGNSGACIDVSPYKFDGAGGAGIAPNIHKLPAGVIIPGLKMQDGTSQFQEDPVTQLELPARQKLNFIHESILSCAGQILPPPGYLKSIYQQIHSRGGLCIADEVQTGLGRTGEKYWAFELFDILPDIVTIGKPFGNGHPIGAVVTTREIADAFANGMEFFSSFGGNPVSCAIALRVLQIIEEEDLQCNAFQVGNYLKKCLLDLKSEHQIIGDIRSMGFFLGIEFVLSRETRLPATHKSDYFINRMREHKILMSTDGPGHNVLKFKPPMCFGYDDADFLISTMDKVLNEDFCKI